MIIFVFHILNFNVILVMYQENTNNKSYLFGTDYSNHYFSFFLIFLNFKKLSPSQKSNRSLKIDRPHSFILYYMMESIRIL